MNGERRQVRRQLALLGALALVLSGCSQGVDIYRARVSVDGTVVVLAVAACQANATVELDERDDRVIVRVRPHYEDDTVDYDCADAVYFELSEPLGTRLLIDASDGSEVEVTVSETVTSVP